MSSKRSLCDCIPDAPVHNIELLLFLVISCISCSSNWTTGCPWLPVCQPCMSQHHHPRSVGPAGVWVWGWSCHPWRCRAQRSFVLRQAQLRIDLHPELVIAKRHLRRRRMSESAGRCLSPSTPSCSPWYWPPSSNTFCTPSTCRVRIPGTTRRFTCFTLSFSQVAHTDPQSSGCTCRVSPLMLLVTRLTGCSSTPAFLSLTLSHSL